MLFHDRPARLTKLLLLILFDYYYFVRAVFGTTATASAIAVDSTDMYELIASDRFVDKSLFLRDFLKGKEKISRITRPRGWGKSTNLDMLRRFIGMEVNRTSGEPILRNQSSDPSTNFKLFVGGEIELPTKNGSSNNNDNNNNDNNNNNNNSNNNGLRTKLLKPLRIAEHGDVMKMFGKFPVIYVSFKDVSGSSYRQIEGKLKKLISDLYSKEFGYIRPRLDARYIQEFDDYCEQKFDKFELEHSLLFLSRLVYARLKAPVYVLVDDYDGPATSIFYHLVKEYRKSSGSVGGANENVSDVQVYIKTADSYELFKVMSVIEAMIGQCLKNNRVLQQAIVNGIFDLNLSLFGGVTEALSYSMLDQTYSDYFGFYEDELDQLLAKNGSDRGCHSTVDRRKLRQWYGYNFLGYTVYNPWSVQHFLANDCKYEHYWSSTNGPTIVDDVLSSDAMQEGLQNLTGAEVVFKDYRTKINFDFLAGDYKLLLFSGYLNPKLDGFMVTDLSIPNREIEHLIKMKIAQWVCVKFAVQMEQLASIAGNLAVFDAEKFGNRLAALLTTTAAASNVTENKCHYSGLMKTIVFLLEGTYSVQNDQISYSKNKSNIALISRANNDSAIVIDYKFIANPDQLQIQVNAAWKSLTGKVRRGSVAKLPEPPHGVKRLLKLVLIFCCRKLGFEYEVDHL